MRDMSPHDIEARPTRRDRVFEAFLRPLRPLCSPHSLCLLRMRTCWSESRHFTSARLESSSDAKLLYSHAATRA